MASRQQTGDHQHEQRVDGPELDRFAVERPQERNRIAAPISDSEDPERSNDKQHRAEYPELAAQPNRDEREGRYEPREQGRVSASPTSPQADRSHADSRPSGEASGDDEVPEVGRDAPTGERR